MIILVMVAGPSQVLAILSKTVTSRLRLAPELPLPLMFSSLITAEVGMPPHLRITESTITTLRVAQKKPLVGILFWLNGQCATLIALTQPQSP
jgi:hypothetical protein